MVNAWTCSSLYREVNCGMIVARWLQGLGKTLQTIAVLGYMYNIKKQDEPHLVIAPKSTLSNWKNEFVRWCPSLDTCILTGTKEERVRRNGSRRFSINHFPLYGVQPRYINTSSGWVNERLQEESTVGCSCDIVRNCHQRTGLHSTTSLGLRRGGWSSQNQKWGFSGKHLFSLNFYMSFFNIFS